MRPNFFYFKLFFFYYVYYIREDREFRFMFSAFLKGFFNCNENLVIKNVQYLHVTLW